jgi:hypothetical protein
MAGVGKSDIIQVAYGYGLFTGGLGVHYGAEKVGASVIPISGGNTKKQIQLMADFGSTVIACTPSYAAYLGESIRKEGIDPKKIKLKAGIFGEMDKLNGVSSNIMMGQKIHAGTNNCEILIDEYKLMEQLKNMNRNNEDLNDINEITETNIDKLFDHVSDDDDSDCDYDNFSFACD